MSLLEIRDYRLAFDTFDGTVHVLDGIDLSLDAGETLGIVGETGCGKSVLARSLLRLNEVPPARVVSGAILFEGEDVLALPEAAMRRLRGRRIAMVFQDPASYLNPLLSIGTQMEDAIRGQEAALGGAVRARRAIREEAAGLLASVGMAEPRRLLASHPHQLSGGMRQRVLIAMALSGPPRLLIADEPTTALDVTIQAQILELLRELIDRLKLTVIMISHDVGAIAAVSRRIAVMYAGTIVEQGDTRSVLNHAAHPYTNGLLASLPEMEGPLKPLRPIAGHIPNLIEPPAGCRFHPRCPKATEICRRERPPQVVMRQDHVVACHHPVQDLETIA